MAPTLWLPLLVALVAGLTAGRMQQRLPPPVAAFVLTAVAVISALAVAWGLAIVAFGFLVQIPWVAERAGWCHLVLPSDDQVPSPLGLLSLVAFAVATSRAWRSHRRLRWLTTTLGDYDGPIEIVPLPEPTAFAVPGRPGHIVVSQAMLDCLGESEQRVLFAHEQAHLDHHHHRYVRLADLAAAAVPLLRPIASNVRLATERWADEVAVGSVGDRRVVANAIGRAALAASGAVPAPALGVQSQVTARLEALLGPPPATSLLAPLSAAAVLSAVVVVLIGASLQLHHFVTFAAHVCRL